MLLGLHNWEHLPLHNSHTACISHHANFVTGIEGRDRPGPSQQYSSKEVETMITDTRSTIRLLLVLIFLTTLQLITPGIHAREWISPATVTYVMNELITNPQHGRLLNMFDFFILPVTNPDGWVICGQ